MHYGSISQEVSFQRGLFFRLHPRNGSCIHFRLHWRVESVLQLHFFAGQNTRLDIFLCEYGIVPSAAYVASVTWELIRLIVHSEIACVEVFKIDLSFFIHWKEFFLGMGASYGIWEGQSSRFSNFLSLSEIRSALPTTFI